MALLLPGRPECDHINEMRSGTLHPKDLALAAVLASLALCSQLEGGSRDPPEIQRTKLSPEVAERVDRLLSVRQRLSPEGVQAHQRGAPTQEWTQKSLTRLDEDRPLQGNDLIMKAFKENFGAPMSTVQFPWPEDRLPVLHIWHERPLRLEERDPLGIRLGEPDECGRVEGTFQVTLDQLWLGVTLAGPSIGSIPYGWMVGGTVGRLDGNAFQKVGREIWGFQDQVRELPYMSLDLASQLLGVFGAPPRALSVGPYAPRSLRKHLQEAIDPWRSCGYFVR